MQLRGFCQSRAGLSLEPRHFPAGSQGGWPRGTMPLPMTCSALLAGAGRGVPAALAIRLLAAFHLSAPPPHDSAGNTFKLDGRAAVVARPLAAVGCSWLQCAAVLGGLHHSTSERSGPGVTLSAKQGSRAANGRALVTSRLANRAQYKHSQAAWAEVAARGAGACSPKQCCHPTGPRRRSDLARLWPVMLADLRPSSARGSAGRGRTGVSARVLLYGPARGRIAGRGWPGAARGGRQADKGHSRHPRRQLYGRAGLAAPARNLFHMLC